jgi:phosphoribosyl-AMP cyclohydrolase
VAQLQQAISQLKYDADGLIPAIIVDADSKAVLMLAYMNETALAKTIKTGRTHFWSRSRREYWMKGESSGHVQQVRAIYTDCDGDTLMIEVTQRGGACHEGYFSCFHRRLDDQGRWDIVADKVFDPGEVYKNGE